MCAALQPKQAQTYRSSTTYRVLCWQCAVEAKGSQFTLCFTTSTLFFFLFFLLPSSCDSDRNIFWPIKMHSHPPNTLIYVQACKMTFSAEPIGSTVVQVVMTEPELPAHGCTLSVPVVDHTPKTRPNDRQHSLPGSWQNCLFKKKGQIK